MFNFLRVPTLHSVSVLAAAAMLSVTIASAQSNLSPNESSSSLLIAADGAGGTPEGGAGAAGGNMHHRYGLHSNQFAFEAGAGFNAPVGNDLPYITWGGNFTVGAGLHLNKRFAVLGEFEFLDNKLPGAFIAAVNGGGSGNGGNAHIIALTVDPVIDLFPKKNNSIYVTGGGGYYHKSTNFTTEVCCDYYGYAESVTEASFTSNQVGANMGLGISHRFGGIYNDSTMKVFAEARYHYIHTPSITQTNGLGTTELIPVTVGFRW
jgi:hypothetical protein